MFAETRLISPQSPGFLFESPTMFSSTPLETRIVADETSRNALQMAHIQINVKSSGAQTSCDAFGDGIWIWTRGSYLHREAVLPG